MDGGIDLNAVLSIISNMSEQKEECFNLPYGNAICGLIIGVIIILWGASYFIPGIGTLITYYWPILLLVLGVVIIIGAIYAMARSRARS